MCRFVGIIVSFTVLALIAGCATMPPITHDIKSEETYNAPFDKVWEPAINYFNNKNIPVRATDQASGIIESGEVKIPYDSFVYYSEYADCGTLGGLYVYHDILGKITVYLKKLDTNKTSVQIVTDYRASLWTGNNFKGWTVCQSKGYIEKSFLEYLNSTVQVIKEGPGKKPEGDKTAIATQKTILTVTKLKLPLPVFSNNLFREIFCTYTEQR